MSASLTKQLGDLATIREEAIDRLALQPRTAYRIQTHRLVLVSCVR